MDAESLARKRWRPVAKVLARRERIGTELAAAREQSGELHRLLPGAERRDREARGRALAEGKSTPPLEAPLISAELEGITQRAEDLQAAAEVVEGELRELREQNREGWLEQQNRQVERARRAILERAQALEAAVAALEDEHALRAWVVGSVSEGAVDPYGGRLTHAGAIAAALDQVKAAIDGIATGEASPTPQPVQGRKLVPMERPGWGR